MTKEKPEEMDPFESPICPHCNQYTTKHAKNCPFAAEIAGCEKKIGEEEKEEKKKKPMPNKEWLEELKNRAKAFGFEDEEENKKSK